MKVRPLGDKIIVKRAEAQTKTESGIYLPESAKDKPKEGKIIATGNGLLNKDTGEYMPFTVKKGDNVIFNSYAGTEILDADPMLVWPAWEQSDVVLVSESYGFLNGVGAGDRLTLPTDYGPRDFVIGATFQSYDVRASAVMMSRATYDRSFSDAGIDSLGLYLDDDSDADEIIDRVYALAAGRQSIRVASNAGIREESLRIFDRTFVITDVLYWLTLGVAFIGILSAMLALQLERAREFATLRALGMTPRQVGGMITAQTGVIGLLSGLAAIPLGIVMAYVLIKVINRRAFGWQIDMTVAPDILAVSVVFAIGAALLAGLYPAWRAGQSQPAIAMREE